MFQRVQGMIASYKRSSLYYVKSRQKFKRK